MPDNYVAVIQAGGKGTRLRALTEDKIPKPLLALNGKPMIEWQIENVKKYGIREFVIIIGFLGEKIKEYFGDGEQFGVHIQYIEESEPLGSAGALWYLKSMISCENILLIFGDVMFDVDLSRLLAFHEQKDASATLVVHPNAHPFDSDLVVLDAECRVTNFDSKNNVRDYWYDNLVNAGLYVISREMIDSMQELRKCDLEKELFLPLIDSGKIFGYRTTEYLKDAGTPERFYSVCEDQKKGLWKKRNLEQKQKCIFLDRDGTVNIYRGLVYEEEQFELEETVTEAIQLINWSGYLAILVTNQPVVARGLCEPEDVIRIHKKMSVLLGEQGAYLDDIVFCPHHPDKGYPEENVLYKISCNCRKPKTEMIENMVEKYNISIVDSYMVGDSTIDIQTGKNAGLKTVLLKTGMAGTDGKYDIKADYEAVNLLEAINAILNGVSM